jgi:uncharacterized protein YlbG (UPF0298 family)
MDGPTVLLVESFLSDMREEVEETIDNNPNVLDEESFLKMILSSTRKFIKENYEDDNLGHATG